MMAAAAMMVRPVIAWPRMTQAVLRQGTADYSTDPTSTTTTTYHGYEMLVQGFGVRWHPATSIE
jgi:hypothetical protein